MRVLHVTHQLVGFVLCHLPAANHVLHELSRALQRKCREAGSRTDHVLHRRGHFATSFQADFVRTRSHFGDGVTHILPAMPRPTSWRRGWDSR
jgi:hypothetical protein